MGQQRHHGSNDQPVGQHRTRQPPRSRARGLHHHQFGFARQPVGHIDRRGKGGDGQHRHDQLWQAQRGKFEKHQRRLSVTDQTIEQNHRAVDPEHSHQHQREKAEQQQKLRQHVPVESGHITPRMHMVWQSCQQLTPRFRGGEPVIPPYLRHRQVGARKALRLLWPCAHARANSCATRYSRERMRHDLPTHSHDPSQL